MFTVVAIADGTYFAKVSIADATNLGALTAIQALALSAGSVAAGPPLTDTLRVVVVAAALAVTDEIQIDGVWAHAGFSA